MNWITATWLSLMGLTALGFALRTGTTRPGFIAAVLALTFAKVWLVLDGFMELRTAHPAWRWGMRLAVLLVALAMLVLALGRPGTGT